VIHKVMYGKFVTAGHLGITDSSVTVIVITVHMAIW